MEVKRRIWPQTSRSSLSLHNRSANQCGFRLLCDAITPTRIWTNAIAATVQRRGMRTPVQKRVFTGHLPTQSCAPRFLPRVQSPRGYLCAWAAFRRLRCGCLGSVPGLQLLPQLLPSLRRKVLPVDGVHHVGVLVTQKVACLVGVVALHCRAVSHGVEVGKGAAFALQVPALLPVEDVPLLSIGGAYEPRQASVSR